MIEHPDNDGFSSSDGEFDKQVELMRESQRVNKLRNQIRRIKKEHSHEISKKDERITELEMTIKNLEKSSIQFEELERKFKKIQDENDDLKNQLNKLKLRFSAYQDVGDRMKSRIEAHNEKLRMINLETQKQRNQLKEKESEIERLKNELKEFKTELPDHRNDSQEQSQATYRNFVSESTASFSSKHAVPHYSSDERHEYAKKLDFWNFDNGPLEAEISKIQDSNFTEVLKLHAPLAKCRVTQIFHNGRFVDEGTDLTGTINSLVLSYAKKLVVEFSRKTDAASGMTMRFRKMGPSEIRKNHTGFNNHFHGQKI